MTAENHCPGERICVVLGAMPISEREAAQIRALEGALLICADAGYAQAMRHGLTPDFTVGDYDSLEGSVTDIEGVKLTFPVEKDDTDAMLAAKEGLARGCRRFLFYGALGGRLDHTLANITMLRYLIDFGATGWLLSEENCVTLLKDGALTLERDAHYPHLSVFSYEGEATGVLVQGGKYTPVSHSLNNCFPLGVSNAILGERAIISVKRGILLIVLAA
ncbi:MAG: thiamine diphosphokinase [Clostridiales bacterium]|nr:thiamine diphosphokinase [Clostridiales bacterium]